MLRPAPASEVLQLVAGARMSRGDKARLCEQAVGSDCMAFEWDGAIAGFGGYWREETYLECWFMALPALAGLQPMRALIRALRTDMIVAQVLYPGRALVAHVRAGNKQGEQIAQLLGFANAGESAMREGVNLWAIPAI